MSRKTKQIWEEKWVEAAGKQEFPLRFKRSDYLKVKVLARYNGYKSVNEWCMEAIVEALYEQLDALLKDDPKGVKEVTDELIKSGSLKRPSGFEKE